MDSSDKYTVSAASHNICPVTGLTIIRKPEWTYFNPQTNFRVSLEVVGNQILVSRPTGAPSSADVIDSLALSSRIIEEMFAGVEAFVQIGDYSAIRGVGLRFKERKRYIKTLINRSKMAGLIFVDISSAMKFSVKLGFRLNPTSMIVQIVDTYAEAVSNALNILSKASSDFKQTGMIDRSGKTVTFGLKPKIVRHPDWTIQLDGFSASIEILDDTILHSVSAGYLREKHIPHINALRERVRKSMGVEAKFDYFVAGVPHLEGSNWKARQEYMASVNDWHSRWPFKMYVFYSPNRFIRSAANMARPFLPFKVKVATDFNEALQIVRKHQIAAEREEKPHVTTSAKTQPNQFQTDRYVQELLNYLGSIRWENDGLKPTIKIEASHPFADVFDALQLLKSEWDDLLKERENAEKALLKARDNLEARVAERTNELVNANAELAKKVDEHRQMLSALEKSHRKLKQTQDQLVQTAKLASLGELTAGVAHELNQPLMVIRTNAQVLQQGVYQKLADSKDLLLPIDMIERNTKRMMGIMGQLRTFARSSEAIFEPIDINRIVEDTFLIAGPPLRRKKIDVVKKLADGLPFVNGEANRLEQVFLNLITNAVDAMGENGILKVTTRCLTQGQKSSRATEDSSANNTKSVEILFKDTGTGVANEHLDCLFDPFFTTKKAGQGTGLGLSISFGIIKDHNGEIDLAETGPTGTTMRIVLPAENTRPA